ncbi:MAG: ABC transporter ATP-binding protein [Candidatus Eiseniibacteriota bacterium]
MRPALEAHVAVTLGSFTLDASLAVQRGEVLVLLGPNGSGKTTCLDLLAGLRAPDRGRVTLDGTVLCDTERGIDLAPEERRVGLVFQDFALFPHRTVRGNVDYGPRARGESREAATRTAAEWLTRLDLHAMADRPVGELSGGQKQRVAIARALASGARVLLLDEPFASLDATMRAGVRAELRVFLRSVGCPAVLVTHDPLDAFVMADRVAVLEGGRVVQAGTGEELLAHPRTPFVAELVGLNFYQAELAPGSGLKEARVGGATFHVLADALEGAVHLAFAPSDVALFLESSGGSFQNTFEARVRETRSLPDRVRVILDAGIVIAADVTREASRRLDLAPGSVLRAMIKATSIRVYP